MLPYAFRPVTPPICSYKNLNSFADHSSKLIVENPPSYFEDSLKTFNHPQYDKYKAICIPKNRDIPKFQEKGLILIWPPKRHQPLFYYRKEIIWVSWILAHALYWAHVVNLFPSGRALPFKQPQWKFEPQLRKPESRDYIIEPDWNSRFL